MKVIKMIGIGLLVLLLMAALFMVYRLVSEGAKSREMAPTLGVIDGRLLVCPDSPNCVSSYETDERHSVVLIEGDETLLSELASHIDSLAMTNIVEQSPNYVYATYQSKLFGFVDDLELYFDGSAIQVRSASRVGYSDLGANASRIEKLRSVAAELKTK